MVNNPNLLWLSLANSHVHHVLLKNTSLHLCAQSLLSEMVKLCQGMLLWEQTSSNQLCLIGTIYENLQLQQPLGSNVPPC